MGDGVDDNGHVSGLFSEEGEKNTGFEQCPYLNVGVVCFGVVVDV